MPKDRLVTEEEIENAVVHLPPVLGLAPGRWLAAVFALLLAAVLFSLLIFPGLVRPGTLFRVSSRPAGAAVLVDGAYAGTTPCEVFVRRGTRDIRISRPWFLEEDLSRPVGSRLVASALLPRVENIEADLSLVDGEGLWRDAVREFSEWNLAGESSSAAPLVLESAAAARFANPAAPAPSWEERRDFVLAAARVTATSSSARELLRAASLAFGSGIPDSPEAAEGWRRVLSEETALAELFRDLAPDEAKSLPVISESAAPGSAYPPEPGLPLMPLTLRGVRFLPVPGAGRQWLAESETTAGQYAAFLRERPEWSREALSVLMERGLVTQDYLGGFATSAPDEPVRGVSWHAAQAYTAWLSDSAPQGYQAALPSESLWEAAARAGGDTGSAIWADGSRGGPLSAAGRARDGAGFADLAGNLWEWCGDSFAFRPGLGPEAAVRFPGSERSVRGGSWANPKGTVTESMRSSFPPQWCSPFLGFRPALAAVR